MVVTVILFFILYMIDQVSKFLVERLNVTGTVTVIPNFLEIELSYNKGMAWGQMDDNTIILVIVSAVATVVLCYLASKNDWKHNKFGSAGITLALAGCVGNLFDRLFTVMGVREGVIDMIIFKPFDWICNALNLGTTIFNVADAFLVIGIIMFAIDIIFLRDWKKKHAKGN